MSHDDALQEGLAHHRAGRLDRAASVYRRMLEEWPDDAHAYHLLGAVALQSGDADEAIALMSKAIGLAPHEPHFHYNLGNAFKDIGELAKAIECFRAAIALNPRYTDAHNNMGTSLKNLGRMDEALDCYRAAIGCDPGFANGYKNLASVLKDVGRTDEALAAYRRTVELDPANLSARHMVAALSGETTVGAPEMYVRELFDGYAARFDDHLVNDLGYAVPAMMRQVLERLAGGEPAYSLALDLGCGTGLVGVAIRDLVNEIHGVDLSPRMIERATEKGVYDALDVGDVVAYLARPETAAAGYDLVLAADLFIYFGDLAPVFAAVAAALSPGGVFVFSVECFDGGSFRLVRTGRYRHSRSYVGQLADEHAFSADLCESIDIRRGVGGTEAGDLYVLRSKAV